MNINAWENVLEKGLSESAFPSYAAAVGRGNDIFFKKTAVLDPVLGNQYCTLPSATFFKC